MEKVQRKTSSSQNGLGSIFDSVELQEVPESEIVSRLEKDCSDDSCKNITVQPSFEQNSEKKLAQMMSQDCLKDFRAVLFPGDSNRLAATASPTGAELLKTCAEIDPVSSIIEKVCQEVNGNFETNPGVEEEEQDAVKRLELEAAVNPASYVCPSCFLPFTTEKRLLFHQSRFHMDEHVTKQPTNARVKRPKKQQSFKCKICDKVLASAEFLKQHMRSHADERPFLCTICDKSFRQQSNLNAHMRVHTNEKPFRCKVCDKAFAQSGNMHSHMAIHSDEKRFQCPTCEKSFSQNGSLRNHMKIHSGERPHVCSVCSRDFIRKSHLDAHMRTHTGEKPFICSFCSRAFSQSGDLQSHMRLHTGDLPHVCTECGKGYSAKSHLNKHMRIHSTERPFECSICGKSYNAKSTLVSHMRLHTGDRPYSCALCERRFYSSSHLKKHIKVHHRAYFLANEELRPRPTPRLLGLGGLPFIQDDEGSPQGDSDGSLIRGDDGSPIRVVDGSLNRGDDISPPICHEDGSSNPDDDESSSSATEMLNDTPNPTDTLQDSELSDCEVYVDVDASQDGHS